MLPRRAAEAARSDSSLAAKGFFSAAAADAVRSFSKFIFISESSMAAFDIVRVELALSERCARVLCELICERPGISGASFFSDPQVDQLSLLDRLELGLARRRSSSASSTDGCGLRRLIFALGASALQA